MRTGAAAAIGLALLGASGLTSTAGTQGEGGRRAAGGLVVVDSVRREVGPVIGIRGTLAFVALEVSDHFFPLTVGRDQIVAAVAQVVFVNTTCQSPAFILTADIASNSAATIIGLNNGLIPAVFSTAGIGPDNRLLAPTGVPIRSTPLAIWDPTASPPCQPLELFDEQDLAPTEVIFDLGVFVPPFRVVRP